MSPFLLWWDLEASQALTESSSYFGFSTTVVEVVVEDLFPVVSEELAEVLLPEELEEVVVVPLEWVKTGL